MAQTPKRKIPMQDIVLMLVTLFVLIRTPWNNMTSFHTLLFFLLILCYMLRISNMRKRAAREAAQREAKEQEYMKAQAIPETISNEEIVEGLDEHFETEGKEDM